MNTTTNRFFRSTYFTIFVIAQLFSMQSTLPMVEIPSKKSDLSIYYDILDINEHATPKQIKTAYQALMKKYNPDNEDQQDKDAIESEFNKHEVMQKIENLQEAYRETLKIALRRAKFYDKIKELSIGKFITTPHGSTILHTYHNRPNNTDVTIEKNQIEEISQNIASNAHSSDDTDETPQYSFPATIKTISQDLEDDQSADDTESNTHESLNEKIDEDIPTMKVAAKELIAAAMIHAHKYYTAIQAQKLVDESKIEDESNSSTESLT